MDAIVLGGAGVFDYTVGKIGEHAFATQVWAQIKAVVLTLAWSGIGSAIIYKVVDIVVGLRVKPEQEREGLDLTEQGERTYVL